MVGCRPNLWAHRAASQDACLAVRFLTFGLWARTRVAVGPLVAPYDRHSRSSWSGELLSLRSAFRKEDGSVCGGTAEHSSETERERWKAGEKRGLCLRRRNSNRQETGPCLPRHSVDRHHFVAVLHPDQCGGRARRHRRDHQPARCAHSDAYAQLQLWERRRCNGREHGHLLKEVHERVSSEAEQQKRAH